MIVNRYRLSEINNKSDDLDHILNKNSENFNTQTNIKAKNNTANLIDLGKLPSKKVNINTNTNVRTFNFNQSNSNSNNSSFSKDYFVKNDNSDNASKASSIIKLIPTKTDNLTLKKK